MIRQWLPAAFLIVATTAPAFGALPPPPVVAHSHEELRTLVADPNGPSEITLPAGSYRGELVIKRGLTLRGEPGTVLEGSGTGTVLTIDANDVTVEHLAIAHSGRRSTTEDAGLRASGERVRITDVSVKDTLFGVTFQACHFCLLDHVHVEGDAGDTELRGDGIKLWESHDSIVRNCTVNRARDVVVWYTRRALLENNTVRHGRYGTHLMYAHDSIVRDSHVEGNVVGIFVMYSQRLTIERNVLAGARGAAGMGIGFKESDSARINGNWFVGNTTGVYLDATPRTPSNPVYFEGNVLALNETALRVHGISGGVIIRGNDFRNNPTMVETDGGGDALACEVRGNHFTDYEGYDLNGDGVGDVPFRVSELSSTVSGDHELLKFFYATPAMQALDAIAHAVPILDSRVLFEDRAPLVRAPEIAMP